MGIKNIFSRINEKGIIKMGKFEYEFLEDFDLSSIELTKGRGNGYGRWINIFYEWLATDNKVLKLSLTNAAEKKTCQASIRHFIKKNHLDWTVYNERAKYNIYVVRAV